MGLRIHLCVSLSHMGLPEAVNILDQKSEAPRRGSNIPRALSAQELLPLSPGALALQRPCCLGTAGRISQHGVASSPIPAGLPRCQQVWDDDRLAAVEMGWTGHLRPFSRGPRVSALAESPRPPSSEVPTHPESDAGCTWSARSWGSTDGGVLPCPAGSEPSLGLCVDVKPHPLTVQILAKQGHSCRQILLRTRLTGSKLSLDGT